MTPAAGKQRGDSAGAGASGWRLAGLALAWLAGNGLHLRQAELWPASICGGAVLLGVAGLAAGWRWRRGFVAALTGAALLAWGSAGWRADERLAEALPAALEGRDLIVTGVVATLPQRSPSGVRFRFDVESARQAASPLAEEPVQLPRHLALGWYRGFDDDAAAAQPGRELRAGQRWRLAVKLRRPHGGLNPDGFDYELYLFEQGLRATGYVRDAPAPALLHPAAGYPVERLRQRVRDGIEASVPDPRIAGVLAALAVGDQGAIAHWVLTNKFYARSTYEGPRTIIGVRQLLLLWRAAISS